MNRFTLRQSLLLLLTATIWGSAFVAQSVGMEYIGPFTFSATRNMIGALALLPVISFLRWLRKREEDDTAVVEKQNYAVLLKGGICCGVVLFVASNLQQIGIQYTTVGKAGFITAMYIVLVPILSIFLKKKAGLRVWIGVLIAVAGLYMLCMTDGSFVLQMGDFLVLICALTFAVHILVIDYFSPQVDAVKMSCIQFLVCGILSGICMFAFERPDITSILQAWAPILYAGVLSSGVAYTLQVVGQKGMNPTVASLIMSLESVMAVIAGWIILGEALSKRELLGCSLMFAAIVLVQLPTKKKEFV